MELGRVRLFIFAAPLRGVEGAATLAYLMDRCGDGIASEAEHRISLLALSE